MDYEYSYAWDARYCYEKSNILRNKLDLIDIDKLHEAKRRLAGLKISGAKATPIRGKLDFKHLCAIHKYIFGDIYAWAGELRTVNIAKGNAFCNCAGKVAELIDENLVVGNSFGEFLAKLKRAGCDVKLGKHTAVKLPDGKKNIRFDSLDAEYTEIAIRHHVAHSLLPNFASSSASRVRSVAFSAAHLASASSSPAIRAAASSCARSFSHMRRDLNREYIVLKDKVCGVLPLRFSRREKRLRVEVVS